MIKNRSAKLEFLGQAGFSLIELLVAVGILLLLLGGGIASFINFNEKQQVISAGKELQQHLRSAQTLARVGDTPTGCGSLTGYNVTSVNDVDGKTIILTAVCSGGNIERNRFSLPSGTSLTADIDITFFGLYGGASGATSIEVISNSGRSYTFEVTPGGEITIGEIL